VSRSPVLPRCPCPTISTPYSTLSPTSPLSHVLRY
jgi:hypothetical protein